MRASQPWILYSAAVVLLVTGFSLLFHGSWIGLLHVVLGFALLALRVGWYSEARRKPVE